MKVAAVGAGPAGLAVAELAVRRHDVVVYEMWPYPGGLLLDGIPGVKLNQDIVFARIHYLEQMGIKFVCNSLNDQLRRSEMAIGRDSNQVLIS